MTPPDDDALPYATPDLPGVGGRLKDSPDDFVVEELPLYGPEGVGDHVYLEIRRTGWNTGDVRVELARLFDLPEVDVGYAGLKDKHARTTQTFSIRAPTDDADRIAEQVDAELDVEVLSVSRHRNKLRVGHLLGNRFDILLRDVAEDAMERARAIAAALVEHGLPNYFGDQRFGNTGDNARLGREVLRGRRRLGRWKSGLLLSAFQSRLFNLWLATRMQDGLFRTLLAGDVAKKIETGGLFTVEDVAHDARRFAAGDITYTGPMFGAKMRRAEGGAGPREDEILAREDLAWSDFDRSRLKGNRRRARLLVDDLAIAADPHGLRLAFSLPKGSYATVLLREIMKG